LEKISGVIYLKIYYKKYKYGILRHQIVVNKMSLNNATLGLKGGIAVFPFPALKSSLQHEGFFYLEKGGCEILV